MADDPAFLDDEPLFNADGSPAFCSDDGCCDTEPGPECAAQFNWLLNDCVIDFTDQSTASPGVVNSWEWRFGDGQISNEQHPSHTYDENGTYVVVLIITTSDGCADSTSQQIDITDCTVVLYHRFNNCCFPTQSVRHVLAPTLNGAVLNPIVGQVFKDSADPNSFGDCWEYIGLEECFSGCLQVFDFLDTAADCADPKCECFPPFDPDCGCWTRAEVEQTPILVDLTITGVTDTQFVNEPITCADFINGHYPNIPFVPGIGDVCCLWIAFIPTGWTAFGLPEYRNVFVTLCRDQDANQMGTVVGISANPPGTPTAVSWLEWSKDTLDPCECNETFNRDDSGGGSCYWSTGGPNGTERVTLRAPAGCGQQNPPPAPVANADFNVALNNANLSAVFTDISTPSPGQSLIFWKWDFGDNGFSNLQHPTHTFADSGPHTVTLQVIDTDHRAGDTSQSIEFVPVPTNIVADFGITPDNDNLSAQFTDMSTPATGAIITQWTWDFGDGQQSFDQSPSHVFSSVGTYDVTLTVFDSFRNTDNITKPVTFTAPVFLPTANFNSSVNQQTKTAIFTDTSTVGGGETINAWLWNFGDGATSTQQHPSHVYAADGDYNVSLKATDSTGDQDTIVRVVNIETPIPSANCQYCTQPVPRTIAFTMPAVWGEPSAPGKCEGGCNEVGGQTYLLTETATQCRWESGPIPLTPCVVESIDPVTPMNRELNVWMFMKAPQAVNKLEIRATITHTLAGFVLIDHAFWRATSFDYVTCSGSYLVPLASAVRSTCTAVPGADMTGTLVI